MNFLKVIGHNVGGFDHFEIDLSRDHYALLVGPNGSGKSTVLGCLKMLITEDVPAICQIKADFQRLGPGKVPQVPSWVEGEMMHNGHKIVRHLGVDDNTAWIQIDDGVKVKGWKASSAEFVKVVAVEKNILNQYVVIEQGQLKRIMSALPSERKAALQKLTGADRMEPARAFYSSLALNIMAPDLQRDIDAAQASATEVLVGVRNAIKEVESLQLQLGSLMPADQAKKLVDDAAAAASAMADQKHWIERMQELEGELPDIKASMEEAGNNVKAWGVTILGTEANRKEANEALAAWDVVERNYNRLVDLQRLIKSHAEAEPKPPILAQVSGDLEEKRSMLPDLAIASERASRQASDYAAQKIGKCDICGKPCRHCRETAGEIEPDRLRELKAAAATALKEYQQAKNYVDLGALAVKANEQKEFQYATNMKAWGIREADLDRSFAEAGEYPKPDTDSKAKYIQVQQDYERHFRSLRGWEASFATRKAKYTQVAKDIETAQKRLEAAKLAAAEVPDAVLVQKAGADRETRSNLDGALAQTQKNLASLKKMEDSRKAALDEVVGRHNNNMKLRQFKVLLERMAEVLHRDALPSRVMIGTMHTIAAKANEALPRLGKRFLTYVDGETFRVVFDDKRDLPAHMLSGGQAADWCVAFLFAIMELFSQELGLLIGDELTAEMDDNAVAALGEMLGTFSQILSNRSTQLIISTHHLSMGDYADRVIDVLTLNQPQEAA